MESIIENILDQIYPINFVRWLPQGGYFGVEFSSHVQVSRTDVNLFFAYHMSLLGHLVYDIYFFPDDCLVFKISQILEE